MVFYAVLQAQGNHFQEAPGGSLPQKSKSKIKPGNPSIECTCLQTNNLRHTEVLHHSKTGARCEA